MDKTNGDIYPVDITHNITKMHDSSGNQVFLKKFSKKDDLADNEYLSKK